MKSLRYMAIAESEEIIAILDTTNIVDEGILIASKKRLKPEISSNLDRPLLHVAYKLSSLTEYSEELLTDNQETLAYYYNVFTHHKFTELNTIYPDVNFALYVIYYDTFMKACETNSDLLSSAVLYGSDILYGVLIETIYSRLHDSMLAYTQKVLLDNVFEGIGKHL